MIIYDMQLTETQKAKIMGKLLAQGIMNATVVATSIKRCTCGGTVQTDQDSMFSVENLHGYASFGSTCIICGKKYDYLSYATTDLPRHNAYMIEYAPPKVVTNYLFLYDKGDDAAAIIVGTYPGETIDEAIDNMVASTRDSIHDDKTEFSIYPLSGEHITMDISSHIMNWEVNHPVDKS